MALCVEIRKQMGSFRLEVQFQAEAETLALLGASGCGKSVTLKCIAGILRPDEGHIELDGQTLFDSRRRIDLPPQKRHVGYLFQQYALFPNMTVRQNIAAAVPNRAGREEAVARQLRLFRLEDVAQLRPRQLSGGQQQRTALARILASGPRAILLDEPFSALDSYLREQLELELADITDRFDGPVLWVSHDRGEVFRNCGRICVLDQGRSQPVTTPQGLLRSPGSEAAARLSGCKNYADAQPRGQQIYLPQWKLRLVCAGSAADTVRRVGIWANQLRPAAQGDLNAFSCQVLRVIQDAFSVIVVLRPQDALPESPVLRMELSPALWAPYAKEKALLVSVAPESLLLLE